MVFETNDNGQAPLEQVPLLKHMNIYKRVVVPLILKLDADLWVMMTKRNEVGVKMMFDLNIRNVRAIEYRASCLSCFNQTLTPSRPKSTSHYSYLSMCI